MHVDDVRADADVHGDGHTEPARRAEQADAAEWRLAVLRGTRRPTAPRPQTARRAVANRVVEAAAGLVGHAELPWPERAVDVLGGRARERDLEIVNQARAVHRDRRDEAALHEIDEHGREAGLDHVRAEAPDDRAIVGLRLLDRGDDRDEDPPPRGCSAATPASPATRASPDRHRRARKSLVMRLCSWRDASGYVRTPDRDRTAS